jgi:hypothetical protein
MNLHCVYELLILMNCEVWWFFNCVREMDYVSELWIIRLIFYGTKLRGWKNYPGHYFLANHIWDMWLPNYVISLNILWTMVFYHFFTLLNSKKKKKKLIKFEGILIARDNTIERWNDIEHGVYLEYAW